MKDQSKSTSWLTIFTGVLISVGVAGLLAVIVDWFRRRKSEDLQQPRWTTPTQLPPEIQGLTEEEAQARLLEDKDNPARSEPVIPIKKIISSNVFTIFNLSLIGVAIAQFLFSRPWDALLSLLVAILVIGINIAREVFVRKRLMGVEDATRPQAIVLRDGKPRSIDSAEIVRGDVLFVGPGDQFLANGEMISEKPVLVDQSLITHEASRQMKERGDLVDTGSYCVSSHAAFRVDTLGDEGLRSKTTDDEYDATTVNTPLEKILSRIMGILLGIVMIMILILTVRYFRVADTFGLDADAVINAVSLIFSLAPAGLYFMIFLTYVVNTAQLVKYGVLVHQARSIEVMAESTDLCITRAGIERGTTISLQPFPSSEEHPLPNETRLRQILGDFARSSSSNERAIVALGEAFTGEQRELVEEAPYLSAHRWAAVSIDDKDLRGVYVLGEPETLQRHFADLEEQGADQEKNAKDDEPHEGVFRKGLNSIGNFFNRGKSSETEQADEQNQSAKDLESEEPEQLEVEKKRGLRSWFGNLRDPNRSENGSKKQADDDREAQDQTMTEIEYIFAYAPELNPLFDESGYPQLPEGLIPLTSLHYSSHVHPETIETLKALAGTGVNIRIFSSGSADPILPLVEKSGMNGRKVLQEKVLSGSHLVDEGPESFYQSIKGKVIFSETTPEIERRVVEAIQVQDQSAVVVGDGPDDLPAMQQAALTIAWQSSSQAAVGAADIVLLENTLNPLLQVLERGQQCVNGLFDILKLYLTQLLYLFLLLVVFWMGKLGVPYQSNQGSFVALVTLTIPSVGFSFWANTGVIPKENLGRRLSRFVVPAAMTICAAAILVYRFFLDRHGDVAYAQLALTHFLIFSGLVMIILVRRQEHFQEDQEGRNWDLRFMIMVLVLFILYMLFTILPIADKWFKMSHLQQPVEYLIIGAVVLGWVSAFLVIRFVLKSEP